MASIVPTCGATLDLDTSSRQRSFALNTAARHEVRMESTESDRWQLYVYQHVGRPEVAAVTSLSSDFERRLQRDFPLPITTFEDDAAILEWNTPSQYLQIEIRGSDIGEWFYRNSQERTTAHGDGASADLLRTIARFDSNA